MLCCPAEMTGITPPLRRVWLVNTLFPPTGCTVAFGALTVTLFGVTDTAVGADAMFEFLTDAIIIAGDMSRVAITAINNRLFMIYLLIRYPSIASIIFSSFSGNFSVPVDIGNN